MNNAPRSREHHSGLGGLSKSNGNSVRRPPGSKPALIAVDLGAESCRVSLLQWVKDEPRIRMLQRFANQPSDEGNGLRWDIEKIYAGVEEGLRSCAELVTEGIAAI